MVARARCDRPSSTRMRVAWLTSSRSVFPVRVPSSSPSARPCLPSPAVFASTGPRSSAAPTIVRNLIGADPAFADPGPGLQAGINLSIDGNNPTVSENLVGYASTVDNVVITTQRGSITVQGNELVGTLRVSAAPSPDLR